MTKLEALILKFLSTAFQDSNSDVLLFNMLKDEALRQYNAGLLVATEHCDLEAWLDLKLRECKKCTD